MAHVQQLLRKKSVIVFRLNIQWEVYFPIFYFIQMSALQSLYKRKNSEPIGDTIFPGIQVLLTSLVS